MKINRLKYILIFLIIPILTFSQVSLVDSLISLSKTSNLHDSVKIKLYGDISWELMGNDIYSALFYAKQELELAQKTKRKGDIAQAESDIGSIYNRKAIYDTALIHYNKAAELRLQLGQSEKVAGVYTNIATVYMRQNKFKESLQINFKTLKIFEQTGNKSKEALVLGNIGNLYRELKQKNNAAVFYRKALLIANENNLAVIRGRVLLNLGALNLEDFDTDSLHTNSLDSALYFFLESEKIMSQQNDLYNLGVLYNNLGRIYARKKENEKAIVFFEKGLNIREKLEDKYGIGLSSLALGELFFVKKEYEKSISYLEKSAGIFKELKNYLDLKQSFGKISQVYQAKKDFANALKYHELYSQYNDSVYNSEIVKHSTEMQAKYEMEKKDLELAKDKVELLAKEKQAHIKNLIIGSIILMAFLVVILAFTFYKNKQIKLKAKQDSELAAQKDIRSKAIIEAEEKERVRIARDLHDGIGQLLSAAKLNLSSIENKIEIKGVEQQSAFKNAVDLLDESVREVRAVSHNMMPNTLLKLGLVSAVREFITKIQNVPNMKVNLEIVGMNERLEQDKESILYRVIQEVISNIIKHAKAGELGLQLIRDDKELTLIIHDNGVGFDISKINDFNGIGLKNIISRVEFLNGTVHFDSTPGKGTNVIIDIPL